MKPSLPVKVAVVMFSLTLGCAYVGFQGVSAPRPTDTAKTTVGQKTTVVLPSSKSNVGVERLQLRKPLAQAQSTTTPDRELNTGGAPRQLLPSSKSIDHILLNPNHTEVPTNTDFIRPENGTSLSGVPAATGHNVTDILTGKVEAQDAQPRARTILPSSKSGPVFSPGQTDNSHPSKEGK